MLLVEHDPELIARADWVVDMGPGAGRLGGDVLVAGPPARVAAHPASLTGRCLAAWGTAPATGAPPGRGRHPLG